MKKLILIDANHLLSRTFHVPSFQSLTAEIDGKIVYTGATYGFLHSLLKLINKYKGADDKLVIVWDGGGRGFRDELSNDYKANRAEKTDEFMYQLHLTKDFLRMLGVMQACVQGVEADDIIGILTKEGRIKGYKILIISGDKDFNQLVSKNVNVVNPNAGKDKEDRIMTPELVQEIYGIPPRLFADWLALLGDSCDNVDGIDGIGKKTATELICGNGSINDILIIDQHFKISKGERKAVSKKMQEKLNSSKEKLKLSYKLVQIATDLDIDLHIDNVKPDFIKLKNAFKRYSFNSLLQKFNEFVAVFS
jgi:DNA polymerase-1